MKEHTLKRRSLWEDVWKRLRKNRSAVLGMCLFAAIVLSCIGARVFLDFDTDVIAVDIADMIQPPSLQHLFGTDELGRDLLFRVLWGGGTSLLIACLALCFAFCIGLIIGTVAAYYGNLADTIIMRFIDIIMAIPPILLMITLATLLEPSTTNMIWVVGIGLIPNQSRMVRGQVLQVMDKEFIEAAKVQGASDLKIIVVHIIPNAISPIITTIIMDIAYAVTVISTLSYLGLGIQPPDPEWGALLAAGREYIRDAWWITTFPGLVLMLTIIALTLVGDGMRDALDPRMKR